MKTKFIPSIAFLFLLILAALSQYNRSFSTGPGWHMVIYPPEYIISLGLVIFALVLSVFGYTFLAIKNAPLSLKKFITHLLFTIPLIAVMFYPFKCINSSLLTKDELEEVLTQQNWLKYILFSLFAIGHLVFAVYFFKHLKNKSGSKAS